MGGREFIFRKKNPIKSRDGRNRAPTIKAYIISRIAGKYLAILNKVVLIWGPRA